MPKQPEPGFEEELTHVFRQVGEGFQADQQRLTLGGAAYGRRLHRRRATAVAGTAAALALTAVVGTAVAGLPGGSTGRSVAAPLASTPAGAPSSSRAARMTSEQVLEQFKDLLSPARVVTSKATDTVSDPYGWETRYAELTIDDGNGQGFLSLTIRRVAKPNLSLTVNTCPPPDTSMECQRMERPDGSLLILNKFGQPDGSGIERWRANLLAPDGMTIELDETNTENQASNQATRKDPPVAMDRLVAIAVDQVWTRAFASIPKLEPQAGSAGSNRLLPADQLLATADRLLPAGAVRKGAGFPAADGASFSLARGGRDGMMGIRIQDWSGDHDIDEQFATATVLPDGSRMRVLNGPAGPGGLVKTVVDVLGPDRLRVQVYELWGEPSTAPLTVDELKAFAGSPAWHVGAQK